MTDMNYIRLSLQIREVKYYPIIHQKKLVKIINSIDLTNECGIRDKCMVLIAAETGLRASDIVF